MYKQQGYTKSVSVYGGYNDIWFKTVVKYERDEKVIKEENSLIGIQ